MKKQSSTSENKSKGKTTPIKRAEDVKNSKDEKIDQDFPGFPNHPATPEVIKNKGKDKETNAG